MRLGNATASLSLLLAMCMASASGGSAGRRVTTAGLVTMGRAQFVEMCAACHGNAADGGEGPSLHRLGRTPDVIASTIRHGFKDEMPAFTSLNARQVAALAAYVHSLK